MASNSEIALIWRLQVVCLLCGELSTVSIVLHLFLSDQTTLSPTDLYLQCGITSLFCLCQVKVLLRIHRIHTIMSSDRMSTPPSRRCHPCTHLHPSSWVWMFMWCHLARFHRVVLSAEPIGLLMVLQQGGNIHSCLPSFAWYDWFVSSVLPQLLYRRLVFSMSTLSSLWYLWSPWKSKESCPLYVAFGCVWSLVEL